MRKATWTSEDGRFTLIVAVYSRRASFLAALRRISWEPTNNGVRAQGTTQPITVFHPDGTVTQRTVSYLFFDAGWCTPGIFAHEANHIAHHLAKYWPKKGVKREELICSYLDTIVDLFEPWLRKNKLFSKRKNNWHQNLMWPDGGQR